VDDGPTDRFRGQGLTSTGALLKTGERTTLPRNGAVVMVIFPPRQLTILPSTKTSWPSSIGML
jgi:hypothetical protein